MRKQQLLTDNRSDQLRNGMSGQVFRVEEGVDLPLSWRSRLAQGFWSVSGHKRHKLSPAWPNSPFLSKSSLHPEKYAILKRGRVRVLCAQRSGGSGKVNGTRGKGGRQDDTKKSRPIVWGSRGLAAEPTTFTKNDLWTHCPTNPLGQRKGGVVTRSAHATDDYCDQFTSTQSGGRGLPCTTISPTSADKIRLPTCAAQKEQR